MTDVSLTEGRNQVGGWPPRTPDWWCPHPERWHSGNDDAAEYEVSALAAAFVTALQPDVVVETGTHTGQTAKLIGKALAANGQGHLWTVEVEDYFYRDALTACAGLPVTVIHNDSMRWLTSGQVPDGVGFAWIDGLWEHRVPDIMALLPHFAPGAIVGIHDTGPQFPQEVRKQLEPLERAGQIRVLDLRTPRGVSFAQILNEGT